jgi:surfeit locus 1 family protein
MRRLILPLIFGFAGAAILIGLGIWQLQRLERKTTILADITSRISAAPVALPAAPEAARDRYLPVMATGRFTGEEVNVLVSQKFGGIGYRVIAVLETETGRRVLVDRGFLPDEERATPRPPSNVTVTGNLHWPDEVDSFTPAPDPATKIWFARDVPALSAALGTEATLIVAREPTGDGIEPIPLDSSGIPNHHLNYALTWFSLAVVWLGMTGLWLFRIRRTIA